jgi:hypothetical protein
LCSIAPCTVEVKHKGMVNLRCGRARSKACQYAQKKNDARGYREL